VLGFRISKAQRLTNWDAAELTESQLLYAATDAWAALEIYSRLQKLQNDPESLTADRKAANE